MPQIECQTASERQVGQYAGVAVVHVGGRVCVRARGRGERRRSRRRKRREVMEERGDEYAYLFQRCLE